VQAPHAKTAPAEADIFVAPESVKIIAQAILRVVGYDAPKEAELLLLPAPKASRGPKRENRMRAFRAIVVAFCMMGFPMRAHAIGMKFCDDIKDDQSRMACLQEHISHLEETIIALGGQVAALEIELKQKLSAEATFKLRSVAQGKCLGSAGENQPPILVACDKPDSWTLLAGVQIKKPEKPSTPKSNPAPNSANSGTPPAVAPALPPESKPSNPCRGLDQLGCTAKSASCEWKLDKNKCAQKHSQ
jgi:hypothetical protein